MSRTEEDISSRVDITIMRESTLRTYPTSYSEFCDTFRPRLASARRTDSGRERFIDFLVASPVRKRFVAEHVSEGRPACIEDRFRHVGLGECGGVHVAHRDVIELSNDAGRELVLKVTARLADACVDVGRLTPFSGPLSARESGGQLPQVARVFDLLPVGQGSEVLEPQVDANTAAHRPRIRLSDFHGNVQIPMTPGIAGEAGSVLDLTLRQRPRVEHPEGVSSKAKGVALALEVTALEGHPAQRSPAAPTQERELLLTTRLGVLLAHRVDRARVQGEFLAAASGQAIQIETARPALIPFQRLPLGVVAEIPDEITGARLRVQQTRERFDAVSIDQHYSPKLNRLLSAGKSSKLRETLNFRCLPLAFLPRVSTSQYSTPHSLIGNPQDQERHFLPDLNAGVSVLEN